jgi:threonine dehydratase
MVRSIEHGSILTEDISQPTLSDGTAGGMEPGSITFPLCRDLVDEWWLASEEAIAHEIRALLSTQQILAEGSAVLPLAYLRAHSQKWSGCKVVTILTGKRIPLNKLQSILCA